MVGCSIHMGFGDRGGSLFGGIAHRGGGRLFSDFGYVCSFHTGKPNSVLFWDQSPTGNLQPNFVTQMMDR